MSTSFVRQLAEYSAVAIEVVGVAVLVLGVAIATVRYLLALREDDAFSRYRRRLGHTILLGLEILVAADILATVHVGFELDGVLALAVIVLIRTFLSFSIEIELEGRVPWRQARCARLPSNTQPQPPS